MVRIQAPTRMHALHLAHNFRVKDYSGRPFLDGTEPSPQFQCSKEIADAGTV